MKISVRRRAGSPLRDQLVKQLELRILAGDFSRGSKLPSVRALARQVGVHRNTVAAAYRALEATRHVSVRRGVGLVVSEQGPGPRAADPNLAARVRQALDGLSASGFARAAVRDEVRAWLARSCGRVVVVDPRVETAEVLAREIGEASGLPTTGLGFDELVASPASLDGALAVALPYHEERLKGLAPGAPSYVLRLDLTEDRAALMALPEGALVLVVSHAPYVLTFGRSLVEASRGEALHVEGRLLRESSDWRSLVRAADLVFADVLSAPAVRRARPRSLRELHLANPSDVAAIAQLVSGSRSLDTS